MNENIYFRTPISYLGEIPIFSCFNEYTGNYELISSDHIAYMKETGNNPFMDEQAWIESETVTANLIKKYAKPGDKVLDVGVGLGRLLSRIDEPEIKKYGMDISAGYLEIARNKGINVCYSLIEDMPYGKNQFDIVICTDVLEHVIDLNLCISKILSVTKESGLIIIRVPYREELKNYLAPDYPYKFVHLRNFDENNIRLLFSRIFNCEIVECDTSIYGLHSFRPKIAFPRGNRIIVKSVSILKIVPLIHNFIIKSFFYPNEFNIVVKKI